MINMEVYGSALIEVDAIALGGFMETILMINSINFLREVGSLSG